MPLAEQLRYWAGELEGVSAPELPTDQPRPAGTPSGIESHDFVVPGDVAAGLLVLTAQLDVTQELTRVLAALTTTPDAPLGTVTS